jgi:membrane fusion protein (multidrug efflux system)
MNGEQHWLLLLAVAMTGACACTGCKPSEEPEEEVTTEVAVQVGKITRATLRAVVDVFGVVEPEPAGNGKPAGGAALAAPAAGMVMAVPVSEGDTVQAGTVVVRLDDRAALAAVDKARHAVAFAEQQMERQTRLKAVADTSERALQEAEQQLAAARADLAGAQARLALVQLTSPLDGVVARIDVHPGQAVDLNTVVAEVLDPNRLVVTANVPAAEAQRIRQGQPAEVTPADAPETVVHGRVLFTSPLVDPETGTAMVRISLPPKAGLASGRFVAARVVTEEHRDRLAVPLTSVYTDHEGQSTLSIVNGDTAIQQVVRVGLRDGDLVEVEGEGLAEGMTIVTVGSYGLPKETKIRVVAGPQELK